MTDKPADKIKRNLKKHESELREKYGVKEIGDFIEDIINAMNKTLKFVEDISYEEFAKDDKTIFAVISLTMSHWTPNGGY